MYNYRRKELNKRLAGSPERALRVEGLVPKTAIFTGKVFKIFVGTRVLESAYRWLRAVEPEGFKGATRLEG